MNQILYSLYAVLLAIFAFFSGEIITFLMLGFILIVLNSINTTLKQLLQLQKNNEQ